jgi:transcriptional regulator EpsA
MSMYSASTEEATEGRRVQAIAHAVEAAVDVRRRSQFFLWMQGSFQRLLPHTVAICGVYERTRRNLRLEVFNSVVLPAQLTARLADEQSAFMKQLVGAWIGNGGRPLGVHLSALTEPALADTCGSLRDAGIAELLVHGVSRPQRPNEIETLFVFASAGSRPSMPDAASIELLLPHLHSTYLRVQSFERENGERRPQPITVVDGHSHANISGREEQVLSWVREGMSNQEIGAKLGISPLTVKNHVQKILRKLGATNRAQAVARAMSMNLLA